MKGMDKVVSFRPFESLISESTERISVKFGMCGLNGENCLANFVSVSIVLMTFVQLLSIFKKAYGYVKQGFGSHPRM
jgi:hypothetical protein